MGQRWNQALGEALDKLPFDKHKELFKPILADALSDLLNAKVEITW